MLFSLKGRTFPWRPLLVVLTVTAGSILVDDKFGYSILGKGVMNKDINPVVHNTFGIIMGMLIVYQSNQGNARWWEGRLAWESIITHTREAMRIFCCHCNGRKLIKLFGKYLIAFSVTSMHYLRCENFTKDNPCEKLAVILPPDELCRLYQVSPRCRPMACLYACQLITEMAIEEKLFRRQVARDINPRLVTLSSMLGSCERILYTPMPWVYTLHLRGVLLAFLLMTPLAMFGENPLPGECQIYVFISILSYTFLGLEDMACKIQNPFGKDPSDLPLEIFAHAAYRDVKEIISMKYNIYDRQFTNILYNLGQYDIEWRQKKMNLEEDEDDDDGDD